MKVLCRSCSVKPLRRYFLATSAAANRTASAPTPCLHSSSTCSRHCQRYQCKSALKHVHCGSASTARAEHFDNNGREDQASTPPVVPQYQSLVTCSCRIRRSGGSIG